MYRSQRKKNHVAKRGGGEEGTRLVISPLWAYVAIKTKENKREQENRMIKNQTTGSCD